MIGLVRRTAAVAAACVACLTFTAGTAPNAGAASSLCKDYKALAHIRGTRVSDLRAAEKQFRKVAAEAPAKAKADLRAVADAEGKVASGHTASVNNAAIRAAASRAGVIIAKKCAAR